MPVMDPLRVRGDHPVWRVSDGSQKGLRRVSDGVKNIGFLLKFAAQEAYLLKC